jgi:hypothetical protein
MKGICLARANPARLLPKSNLICPAARVLAPVAEAPELESKIESKKSQMHFDRYLFEHRTTPARGKMLQFCKAEAWKSALIIIGYFCSNDTQFRQHHQSHPRQLESCLTKALFEIHFRPLAQEFNT